MATRRYRGRGKGSANPDLAGGVGGGRGTYRTERSDQSDTWDGEQGFERCLVVV